MIDHIWVSTRNPTLDTEKRCEVCRICTQLDVLGDPVYYLPFSRHTWDKPPCIPSIRHLAVELQSNEGVGIPLETLNSPSPPNPISPMTEKIEVEDGVAQL